MFNRKLLGALLIASTSLAPVTALAVPSARPTSSANCVLKAHHVISVTPYFEDEHMGSASPTVQRLRGASFFVKAEPGLTAEWLQLTLYRHLAEMHGGAMQDCPFDVKDVAVTVESAGAGFLVKIISRDAGKADEVLRRAKLLFS